MTDTVWATPSGPEIVGTRVVEFTDVRYPSPYAADADGRRLMARAWYPAQSPTRRRHYFEDDETVRVGHGLSEVLGSIGARLDPDCWDALAQPETASHDDAPVATGGPCPCVVFSHGALSYVGQSWLLAEHLASHGYVVLSVAHPGGAVSVSFADGTEYPIDPQFFDVVGAGKSFDRQAQLTRLCGEIGERHAAVQTLIDGAGDAMGLHLNRWVDDVRAMLDVIFDRPDDDVLAAVDTERVALAGFSFGGAATTIAAHRDHRVRAAVNLDGAEWTGDLFGVDIRVPLLMFCGDFATFAKHYGVERYAFYNEFFYEDLASIGTRGDITRVSLPDVAHIELTDLALVDRALRTSIAGGGTCTFETSLGPANDMVLDFLDHHLAGLDNGWPDRALGRNAIVRPIPSDEVRTWYAQRTA